MKTYTLPRLLTIISSQSIDYLGISELQKDEADQKRHDDCLGEARFGQHRFSSVRDQRPLVHLSNLFR